MMSYISVGHMFIRGGYVPRMDEITVGLLGADYRLEHGHYRIARIYTGGSWYPSVYAPLAQPGLKVKEGDYLLAVNGNPVDASVSVYQAFQDLAGKTVTLTVGPNPSEEGAHSVVVNTIPSEAGLRHVAWIEHNQQVVDRLSGGKIGYVYLPDTAWGGFINFNRYFFSQVHKQGVIIDERFNHGGDLSDYIIDYLKRQPMALVVSRWGHSQVTPPEAIFGPKVMIINQFSGSGGDALPWYFKMDHVGTLVGERTWGGLVGIYGYPALMDGGSITSPRIAVEGLDGTFPVENHGVGPDVTVWQDPQLMRQGHDPQLERAVAVAVQQLAAHPLPQYQRPAWLDYHPHLPPLPEHPTSVSGE
jgi:tricorn protease